MTTLRIRGIALALLLAAPPRLLAFAEDVCPAAGGGWQACDLQPCADDLAADGNFACEAIAMATRVAIQVTARTGGGRRSTAHLDATYYLAQAVGFSPRQAYQIAIHDQAADLLQYEPLDEQAQPMVSAEDCDSAQPPPACELRPRSFSGIDRNNLSGGGVNFHFMVPQIAYGAPPLPMNGLAPDLADPYSEHFLVHVRRWAFGQSPLLCVGGLTVASAVGDYATGDRCYAGTRTPPQYLAEFPFVTETEPLSGAAWIAPLGEQLLRIEDPAVPAHALADYVGAEVAPLAALGLYLHALADRISHHLCVTHSFAEGPRPANAPDLVEIPAGFALYTAITRLSDPQYLLQQVLLAPTVVNPDFFLKFDPAQCDQPAHAVRHSFEAGHAQETLAPEHQTLLPGLAYVYDELLAYARQRGLARTDAGKSEFRERVLAGLVAAISTPEASSRLAALTAFGTQQGFLPLPGYGGLDYAQWSARAGALGLPPAAAPANPPAAGVVITGGGSSGGGAMPTALLALALVLLLQRRYRLAQSFRPC